MNSILARLGDYVKELFSRGTCELPNSIKIPTANHTLNRRSLRLALYDNGLFYIPHIRLPKMLHTPLPV